MPCYEQEDELYGYEEAMRDEEGASYGDARRCPRHPHVKTSSDDGMFDGECGECEAEAHDAYEAQMWEALPLEERERIMSENQAADARRAAEAAAAADDDIPF
jgi:hypothetical protein